MTTFEQRVTEDRRLGILTLLQSCLEHQQNEATIAMLLRECKHRASRDQVRIDFAWLSDAGLVTVEEVADLHIATLTQRGFECAQGICTIPGVASPRS
jgi:hypothetical protein